MKTTNLRTVLEKDLKLKARDLSSPLPDAIEELEAARVKSDTLSTKAEPSVDIEELKQLRTENSRMVKENPQQAARLIRYWLNDEKN